MIAGEVSEGQILLKHYRQEEAKASAVLSVLSFSEWSPHP